MAFCCVPILLLGLPTTTFGQISRWSIEQLLTLCRFRHLPHQSIQDSLRRSSAHLLSSTSNAAEHAAACANAAPTLLSVEEKLVLCEYPTGAPRGAALVAAAAVYTRQQQRHHQPRHGHSHGASIVTTTTTTTTTTTSGTIIAAAAAAEVDAPPGPAACARAARSLSPTERVLLCRGVSVFVQWGLSMRIAIPFDPFYLTPPFRFFSTHF